MICSEWLQADVDRCEVHFCARRGVWTVRSQGGHAVRVLIGRNQVNFDRMWVKAFACPASCLSARGKLKTMTEDVSSPVRPVDRSAGRDGFDWWEEEDGQEEGEIQLSRGYYGDKQSAGFPEPRSTVWEQQQISSPPVKGDRPPVSSLHPLPFLPPPFFGAQGTSPGLLSDHRSLTSHKLSSHFGLPGSAPGPLPFVSASPNSSSSRLSDSGSKQSRFSICLLSPLSSPSRRP